jgi:hypothetical protein
VKGHLAGVSEFGFGGVSVSMVSLD